MMSYPGCNQIGCISAPGRRSCFGAILHDDRGSYRLPCRIRSGQPCFISLNLFPCTYSDADLSMFSEQRHGVLLHWGSWEQYVGACRQLLTNHWSCLGWNMATQQVGISVCRGWNTWHHPWPNCADSLQLGHFQGRLYPVVFTILLCHICFSSLHCVVDVDSICGLGSLTIACGYFWRSFIPGCRAANVEQSAGNSSFPLFFMLTWATFEVFFTLYITFKIQLLKFCTTSATPIWGLLESILSSI